jgi:succinylglutamate desuccinylase
VRDRLIGSFSHGLPGALVVVLGAVHGNEIAGVRAIEEVLALLDGEARRNPQWPFAGKLLGLIGNRRALAARQRFVAKDFNRIWTPPNLRRISQATAEAALDEEDREVAELLALLHAELLAGRYDVLVLLDLHTTSAQGGIFCIPTDASASLRLAKALHAPVILDLFDGVEGTLLAYATGNHFAIGGYPQRAVGVAFEAGQHDDPRSVSHCVAAILNTLRAAGCFDDETLAATPHDAVLRTYADGLPKVTRLRHVHAIRPGDAFRMRPGYVNFQPVEKGEHLADDVTGAIYAPLDGRILMPLYQPQGTDGFFIVEDVK